LPRRPVRAPWRSCVFPAGKRFRSPRKSFTDPTPRRASRRSGGSWPPTGTTIDEVLLSRFPGPRSYTGEDLVEISCHGGRLVSRAILDRLLEAGARAAEGGEFTQRAFLNGKLDLTQAEAVMDVISAQTDLALRCAQRQLQGRLGERIEILRQALIVVIAHVEAYIDFPDEDIDPETGEGLRARVHAIIADLDELRATARQGRILREGVATVICGAPNVGKSSLLNLLLGFDRAIVSEIAGTTRDTIEEVINLDGIPLRLTDTAGLRESGDQIEREGMARTGKSIEEAELILEVFDAHFAPAFTDLNLPPTALHFRVLNKADLGIHPDWSGVEGSRLAILLPDRIRNPRAQNRDGRRTFPRQPRPVTRGMERDCQCAASSGSGRRPGAARGRSGSIAGRRTARTAAADLRSALYHLGEIVGKTDIEEILDVVFGSFCIGK